MCSMEWSLGAQYWSEVESDSRVAKVEWSEVVIWCVCACVRAWVCVCVCVDGALNAVYLHTETPCVIEIRHLTCENPTWCFSRFP